MFPYINFNIKVVSDHYADDYLFDHCADHHMSKSYVVILMHNTVFTSISIHTKSIFLFVILKYTEYQRNPHAKCISHCICHSIVKLLYIGKGKGEICILKNLELKN